MPERIKFCGVEFDALSVKAVMGRLAAVTHQSPFGYVVTPNVDHVVMIDRDETLKGLYEKAAICLCDSRILRQLARFAGVRLSLVTGSDLTRLLFVHVIRPGDRIAIIGGDDKLLASLRASYPQMELVHHGPPAGLRTNLAARRAAASFIASSNARFTFLAVGAPQQEMIAAETLNHPQATGMALCVGASLEFLTGQQRRAPKLMQRLSLEWLHRLASNPRRLWRRYLVDDIRIVPIFLRSLKARSWVNAALAAGLFIGAASLAPYALSIERAAPRPSESARVLQRVQLTPVRINLPPPDLLRPLSPAQAAKENAERPFSARPDKPASSFRLDAGTGTSAKDNAVTCLAQAVYYEAASEGYEGGRAVAQIVLNRVRHPGFPATVCGVVYQGSDRPTGCQFSFTCDGSLLRPPVATIFQRSRKIAEKALAGDVFAPVGHSTHYHADYVLPYWADSLDKTVQIGRHIFYRLRGSLGDAHLFRKAYGGIEVIPQPTSLTQNLPTPVEGVDKASAPLVAEDNTGQAQVAARVGAATANPTADLAKGTLLADELQPIRPSTPQKSVACSQSTETRQLKPMGAEKFQAGPTSSVC